MTRIEKISLPDHDGSDVPLYSSTGHYLGRMVFDGKGNSRIEDVPADLLPYRPIRSKRKYRGGR